jgi:hypothetical protein
MTRRIASWLAVALLVWSVPTRLFGWGRDGHAITAALAEAHLTEGARLGIKALLKDQSLASIASWADEVRPQRDETYNWHFVDIPTSAAFDEERDCYRPNDNHAGAQTDHHNCVVDRIGMFKQVLMRRSASDTERVEALKFIVHFVADVHQPFHAIGEAKGGNGIRINEFGSSQCGEHPCNLHSAWDTGLIAHTNLSQQEYVQHLEQFISQQHLTAGGQPDDWANESHEYAQAAWLSDGEQVDENYYKSQIKVVDTRLALAGLRLAALLNDAFSQQTAPVLAPTTAWSRFNRQPVTQQPRAPQLPEATSSASEPARTVARSVEWKSGNYTQHRVVVGIELGCVCFRQRVPMPAPRSTLRAIGRNG